MEIETLVGFQVLVFDPERPNRGWQFTNYPMFETRKEAERVIHELNALNSPVLAGLIHRVAQISF